MVLDLIQSILTNNYRNLSTFRKASKILKYFPLHKDDVVIDCGANDGTEISLFLKSGCQVYAFEPNPDAFSVLHNRFKGNRKVLCLNQAVLDRNGKMKLYLHLNSRQNRIKWSTGSSLYYKKGNVSEHDSVIVSVVDLSEFINKLNTRIRLLKIDIEGAEYAVINKLINTGVVNKIDYILVETHKIDDDDLNKAANELMRAIKKRGISNIYFNWY